MTDATLNADASHLPMLQPITAMLVAALGPRLTPGINGFLDLFHDDSLLDLPFDPAGPQRLEGKAAIADYMKQADGWLVFEKFAVTGLHEAAGGYVTIEYRAVVRHVDSGVVHQKLYIALLRLRDGRLAEFREYYDPGAIEHAAATAAYIEATGGFPPTISNTSQPAHAQSGGGSAAR